MALVTLEMVLFIGVLGFSEGIYMNRYNLVDNNVVTFPVVYPAYMYNMK